MAQTAPLPPSPRTHPQHIPTNALHLLVPHPSRPPFTQSGHTVAELQLVDSPACRDYRKKKTVACAPTGGGRRSKKEKKASQEQEIIRPINCLYRFQRRCRFSPPAPTHRCLRTETGKHVIRPNPASSEECKTRNVLRGSLD